MTLPLPPVEAHESVQFAINTIAQQFPVDESNVANVFLRLLTSANLRLAFGTGTATFTAAVVSATETKAHGLGATPVFAAVAPAPASNAKVVTLMDTVDGTNLVFRLRHTIDTNISVSQNYYWLAIG